MCRTGDILCDLTHSSSFLLQSIISHHLYFFFPEQYEEAVRDLNKCLEIQKSNLDPDNRLLAETYYQLGLAHCFNKQFEPSTESYKSAIKVIEDRVANLDKVVVCKLWSLRGSSFAVEILLENMLNIAQTDGLHTGSLLFYYEHCIYRYAKYSALV